MNVCFGTSRNQMNSSSSGYSPSSGNESEVRENHNLRVGYF